MSNRNYRYACMNLANSVGLKPADSLMPRPDLSKEESPASKPIPLVPMSDLDLMIKNGWGGTARNQIPSDWKTKKGPDAP